MTKISNKADGNINTMFFDIFIFKKSSFDYYIIKVYI